MCAIFGFIANADQTIRLKSIEQIINESIQRGPHAFGFAWIDSAGRTHAFKQAGRFTDHLGMLSMARDARLLIGHLRYATHGDPAANINNHPHPCDSGWLVHNGVVHNYDELVKDRRLHPVSECDSEAIALMIEQLRDTRLDRSARAAELCQGNLATLGLWAKPASIITVRRGNPLHMSQTQRGFYFATVADALPGEAVEMTDNTATCFTLGKNRPHWKHVNLLRPRTSRVVSDRTARLAALADGR